MQLIKTDNFSIDTVLLILLHSAECHSEQHRPRINTVIIITNIIIILYYIMITVLLVFIIITYIILGQYYYVLYGTSKCTASYSN